MQLPALGGYGSSEATMATFKDFGTIDNSSRGAIPALTPILTVRPVVHS
jgi:hypothetical protein